MRICHELLSVREDEQEMRQPLGLPYRPRLAIVDEQNIAMPRPRDRDAYRVDDQMEEAVREHVKEKMHAS